MRSLAIAALLGPDTEISIGSAQCPVSFDSDGSPQSMGVRGDCNGASVFSGVLGCMESSGGSGKLLLAGERTCEGPVTVEKTCVPTGVSSADSDRDQVDIGNCVEAADKGGINSILIAARPTESAQCTGGNDTPMD